MRHVYINQSGTEEITSATLSNIARLAQQDLDETSDLVGTVHVPSALATTKDAVETRFPNLHVNADDLAIADAMRIDSEEMAENDKIFMKVAVKNNWSALDTPFVGNVGEYMTVGNTISTNLYGSSWYRVKTKVEVAAITGTNTGFFGCSSTDHGIFLYTGGIFVGNNGGRKQITTCSVGDILEIDYANQNTVIVNGTSYTVQGRFVAQKNNKYWFGGAGWGKMYYIQFYQGDTLLEDWVPVYTNNSIQPSAWYEKISHRVVVAGSSTIGGTKYAEQIEGMVNLSMTASEAALITSIPDSSFGHTSGYGNMNESTAIGGKIVDMTCLKYFTNLIGLDQASSATSQKKGVFSGCYSLKRVEFPESLIRICGSAFLYCNLEEVDLKNVKTIENTSGTYNQTGYGGNQYGAFNHNTSLRDVNLRSVEKIGSAAFYDCTELALTSLPSTLDTLGYNVFKNTKCNFESLPESVTTIYGFPWANRTGTQTHPLYNSTILSWSGYNTADDCLGKAVVNNDNVSSSADGKVTVKRGKIGEYAFADNTNVTEVDCGGGAIGNYAFSGCTNLVSAKNGSIGSSTYVFQYCGFTEISDEMWNMFGTIIPDWTFNACSRLRGKVVVPERITEIGGGSFYNSGIEEIVLSPNNQPKNTTQTLSYMSRLRKINCNYITNWRTTMLTNDFSLKLVEFNNLSAIVANQQNTQSLKQIIIDQATIPTISGALNLAHWGAQMRVYVRDNMVDAFKAAQYWTAIADRILPLSQLDRSEYWGVDFFGDKWYDMKRIPTTDSRYYIEAESWSSWANLFGSFPSGHNEQRYGFANTNNYYLGNNYYSNFGIATYNKLGRNFSYNGVADKDGNSVGSVSASTKYVGKINNYLGALNNNGVVGAKFNGTIYKFLWFEGDQVVQAWIGNEEGGFDIFADEDIELQENDVKFPLSAFGAYPYIINANRTDSTEMAANDRALMDVIYAQGWSASPDYMTKEEAAAVTDIGVVFQSKTSITDFSAFKNFVGVTSLANNAFSSCSNLMSIVLPSGVTTIGTNAFRLCSKLSNVHLPSSLTTIGSYAFYSCTQLALTELPVNVESIETAAFYSCSTLNTTMQSCTIKYNNGTIGKSGVLGGYSGSGWSYSLETDNGDGTYTYTK